jgi:hypothetical protein
MLYLIYSGTPQTPLCQEARLILQLRALQIKQLQLEKDFSHSLKNELNIRNRVFQS